MTDKARRKEYDEMFAIVTQVIKAWDPYGLIDGGAPADEFDSEVVQIVAQVPSIRSEQDATLVVSRVFSIMFAGQDFSEEKCRDVGRALFTSLKRGGFIEDA